MKKFHFKTEAAAIRFKNIMESRGYEQVSLILNGVKYTVIIQ